MWSPPGPSLATAWPAHQLLSLLLALLVLALPVAPAAALALPWRSRPAGPQSPAAASRSLPLQELSPPQPVRQLQAALAGRQPVVEILSPRDDSLLDGSPWTLKLRLHDWPLVEGGELGPGPHLVVQIDQEPPRIWTATEGTLPPLSPGSHRLTVYAALPWGEALRNPGAWQQIRLHRTAANPLALPPRGSPQLLAVSPPAQAGAEPLLLDWLLLDAPLQNLRGAGSPWRLRVSINGDSFLLDQQTPLWLRGWRAGVNAVRLELLDAHGDPLNPPFNSLVLEVDRDDSRATPRWLGERLSTAELALLLGRAPAPAALAAPAAAAASAASAGPGAAAGNSLSAAAASTAGASSPTESGATAAPLPPAQSATAPAATAAEAEGAAAASTADASSPSESGTAAAPLPPLQAATVPATTAAEAEAAAAGAAGASSPSESAAAAAPPVARPTARIDSASDKRLAAASDAAAPAASEAIPAAKPEAQPAPSVPSGGAGDAAARSPFREGSATRSPQAAAESTPTATAAVAQNPEASGDDPPPAAAGPASGDAASPGLAGPGDAAHSALPAQPDRSRTAPSAAEAAPTAVPADSDRITPGSSLGGRARDLVAADGTLKRPQVSGPLQRLRSWLAR